MTLDLNKLESKLDNALNKETTESLNEWISGYNAAKCSLT